MYTNKIWCSLVLEGKRLTSYIIVDPQLLVYKESEVVVEHTVSHEGHSNERTTREAGYITNTLLHEHMKLNASHEGDPKYDPSTFSIHQLIKEVDSLQWGFLE